MKKYNKSILIFSAVFLFGAITAFASQNFLENVMISGAKILYNGNEIQIQDAAGKETDSLVYNDTTYVPLRSVANTLGKFVIWDDNTQTVHILDNYIKEIELSYGGWSVANRVYDSDTGEYEIGSALTETYSEKLEDFNPNKFEYNIEMSYVIVLPRIIVRTSSDKLTIDITQPTTNNHTAVIKVLYKDQTLAEYRLNFKFKKVSEELKDDDFIDKVYYSSSNGFELIFYNDDDSYTVVTHKELGEILAKYGISYDLPSDEFTLKLYDAVQQERLERRYIEIDS